MYVNSLIGVLFMVQEPRAAGVKGTTTVALVCKDGVVLGAERRAIMGTHIAHKVTKKIFKIDDNIGITVAGLVGDTQLLVRWLAAEASIYRLKRDKKMTLKAASTLMANILAARRFFPFWVQLLIAGYDDEGAAIYSLDPAGGSIADDYVATGSGMMYVYGVLENEYKKDMDIEAGIDLALKAIATAMKRDAASGDDIDISVVSRAEGYRELSDEEIKARKKKMGL
jgi:proteasome beta subunit